MTDRDSARAIVATLRALERSESRILGARFLCFAADEREAWFALEFGSREQPVLARFDGEGRLAALTVQDVSAPLPELPLLWRSGLSFSGTSLDGLERIGVRVAADGSRLWWEDRDGETTLERER